MEAALDIKVTRAKNLEKKEKITNPNILAKKELRKKATMTPKSITGT